MQSSQKNIAWSAELVLSPREQWEYNNKSGLVGKWLVVESALLLRVKITSVCSEINPAYPAMDLVDSLYTSDLAIPGKTYDGAHTFRVCAL